MLTPPVRARMTQPGIALITGAAVRIGQALALDLAAHGWKVGLHCRRSTSQASELAEQIAALGGEAAVLPADLTDAAAPAHLLRACVSALGAPTLLVNNAAMFVDDEVATLDAAQWDAQLAVNVRAPVFLAKAFAAELPAGATRKRHQYHRPARVEADAALLLLHGLQAGPVGRNAHAGAGAGPAHPRQRHRAGARAAKLAPDGGGVPRASARPPSSAAAPPPRRSPRPSASSLTPPP